MKTVPYKWKFHAKKIYRTGKIFLYKARWVLRGERYLLRLLSWQNICSSCRKLDTSNFLITRYGEWSHSGRRRRKQRLSLQPVGNYHYHGAAKQLDAEDWKSKQIMHFEDVALRSFRSWHDLGLRHWIGLEAMGISGIQVWQASLFKNGRSLFHNSTPRGRWYGFFVERQRTPWLF